jgi:DNA recombination protein RmuC
LQKLGNTLSSSVNHYNSAYKEFKKIDKDVTKISKKKGEVETMEIDKPKQED